MPAGAQLPVRGITPFLTSNSGFYRVDTDIVLPQVSPDTWRLRVHGMVSKELEISFDELLRRPLTEADITLVCVSNQVGGNLNGNARWLGASLAQLLRDAGVYSGADQILSTSTEGMTISTPLAAVIDNTDAMIAVGMNGVPLPVAHGFPARMMVPGLYGYCSGTKWVTDLNVTTFAAEKAYWTQRGYAEQAAIKTMSRIDVPKPLQQIKAGQTAWPESPGRRTAGSMPSKSGLTAGPGTWRRSPRYLASTPGGSGSGTGTPRPESTSSKCVPPTAPAQLRPPGSLSASERSVRLGQRGGDRHLGRIRAIALALIHQPATQRE